MKYTKINQDKWNEWSNSGCVWAVPITHEEFLSCTNEDYPIFLTPQKPVPRSWLGQLTGKKVLALAAGGGQQCPFFVANGALVTVFDISEKQLYAEEIVASREHYSIEIVQGDITEGLPFENNTFDMIFNPVSNSYIDDLSFLWSECNRVLKSKGKLLTGFANPTIYLFELDKGKLLLSHKMPYDPYDSLTDQHRNNIFVSDGVQFGHSFDSQFGGIIDSGFSILGFYEDYHPSSNEETNYDTKIGSVAAALSKYMPIYFSILAEKKEEQK